MTTFVLYGDFFINLLIVLNPISVLFSFISMTNSLTKAERDNLLRKAILFSLVLLISVFLIGRFVILLLNLSLYSFIIVGGLFFLKYGYEILTTISEDDNSEVGVIPLGFPLIAGPGSITLLLIYSSQLKPSDFPPFLVLISVSIGITFLLLKNSTKIIEVVPANLLQGISKGIGLIVMVIGVQIVLDGITLWMVTELNNTS